MSERRSRIRDGLTLGLAAGSLALGIHSRPASAVSLAPEKNPAAKEGNIGIIKVGDSLGKFKLDLIGPLQGKDESYTLIPSEDENKYPEVLGFIIDPNESAYLMAQQGVISTSENVGWMIFEKNREVFLRTMIYDIYTGVVAYISAEEQITQGDDDTRIHELYAFNDSTSTDSYSATVQQTGRPDRAVVVDFTLLKDQKKASPPAKKSKPSPLAA